MSGFQRCNFCAGFLHHSYIASNGLDIYKCTAEDSSNERGRYFLMSVSGPIEVTPTKEGRRWIYEIVDTERRRLQEETKKIEAELDARQAIYRSNMRKVASQQPEEHEDDA